MDASILLKALQEKVQYGVFPQSFLLNLTLDHFLKNKDIKGKNQPTSFIGKMCKFL